MVNDAQTPLSDRELWACAIKVETTHGQQAPRFITERIGALALAGDAAGVATWRAIAVRVDQLSSKAITPGQSGT